MAAFRQIYKGRVVDVRLEEVTLPGGPTITLEVVRHPGAAAVVALDEHGNTVLLRQYRHAAGGFIWEIPAGKLDQGEDPRQCAARELEEEAGVRAEEFIHLGSILTAPGFCDERIHLFLAQQLVPGQQKLDGDEVLTVRRLPFAEALEMIRTGDIQDAKSIAGLHHTSLYLGRET